MKAITSLDKLSNDLKHKIKDVLDVISERENLKFLDKSKRIYIEYRDVQAKMTSETFASILDALKNTFDVIKVTEEYEPALATIVYKLNTLVYNLGKPLPAEYSSIVNKTFYIELTDKFKPFCHSLSQHQNIIKHSASEPTSENQVFWISYSEKGRKIMLNDQALISKPDFASENETVFSFVWKNQNKKLSRDEIEKANNIKLKKSLYQIVNDLGFKGTLRELFFNVSKNAITFYNPITKQDIEERKIDAENISDLIRSNKK